MVGVLTIELAIFEAQSLKDKRRVILSLKTRIRNRFNVSVAEIAYCDSPKQCRLGIAMISNESRSIHNQLDKIVDLIRHAAGATLLDYQRELM